MHQRGRMNVPAQILHHETLHEMGLALALDYTLPAKPVFSLLPKCMSLALAWASDPDNKGNATSVGRIKSK